MAASVGFVELVVVLLVVVVVVVVVVVGLLALSRIATGAGGVGVEPVVGTAVKLAGLVLAFAAAWSKMFS